MGEFPNRATQFKPGVAPNPEGKNQFTYRAEAEQHLSEWCKEHGRDLIRVICDEAKAKKPWAAKLMLDRILPAVQKHEHELPEPVDLEALFARLDAVRPAQRGNGDARKANGSGANGSNGSAS